MKFLQPLTSEAINIRYIYDQDVDEKDWTGDVPEYYDDSLDKKVFTGEASKLERKILKATVDGRIGYYQESLNILAQESLDLDGIMGPKTRAAIERFQEANGLTENGKLDAATKAELEKQMGDYLEKPHSKSVKRTAPKRTSPGIAEASAFEASVQNQNTEAVDLKPQTIMYYQASLMAFLLREIGGIDGKIGKGTKKAIKEFQESAGFSQTGVFDTQTIERIKSTTKVIQGCLKVKPADGLFGTSTQAAWNSAIRICNLENKKITFQKLQEALAQPKNQRKYLEARKNCRKVEKRVLGWKGKYGPNWYLNTDRLSKFVEMIGSFAQSDESIAAEIKKLKGLYHTNTWRILYGGGYDPIGVPRRVNGARVRRTRSRAISDGPNKNAWIAEAMGEDPEDSGGMYHEYTWKKGDVIDKATWRDPETGCVIRRPLEKIPNPYKPGAIRHLVGGLIIMAAIAGGASLVGGGGGGGIIVGGGGGKGGGAGMALFL